MCTCIYIYFFSFFGGGVRVFKKESHWPSLAEEVVTVEDSDGENEQWGKWTPDGKVG